MDVKERNKEVKALLSKEFGRENVSVKNGKGTAWGWCKIEINTPDPCPDKQHGDSCSYYCKDGICKGNNKVISGGWGNTARQEKWTKIREKVDSLLKDVEFDYFYGGSGEDEKMDCMNTEVSFI